MVMSKVMKYYNERGTRKRQSSKSVYITEVVWELEHFKEEVVRTENSSEFFPVWYQGEKFTRAAALRRLEKLQSEVDRIETDASYKPWEETGEEVSHA